MSSEYINFALIHKQFSPEEKKEIRANETPSLQSLRLHDRKIRQRKGPETRRAYSGNT